MTKSQSSKEEEFSSFQTVWQMQSKRGTDVAPQQLLGVMRMVCAFGTDAGPPPDGTTRMCWGRYRVQALFCKSSMGDFEMHSG